MNVPFGNFTSVGNRRGTGGINEPSTMADTAYHGPHMSSSILASLSAEALRRVETGMTDRVAQPASTERTNNANIEKIAGVSSSNHVVKTCSRWFKRLQHKHSETFSPCTKRFKKCDFSSSETQNVCCSRIQNYSTMSHDIKEHKFEKTMTFSEIGSSSLGEIEEDLQSWIKRWRCNNHQTSPAASRPVAPVAFQSSEKLEGKKIASIEAMALMVKAMNNRRPCRIRRKEAFLEWTS